MFSQRVSLRPSSGGPPQHGRVPSETGDNSTPVSELYPGPILPSTNSAGRPSSAPDLPDQEHSELAADASNRDAPHARVEFTASLFMLMRDRVVSRFKGLAGSGEGGVLSGQHMLDLQQSCLVVEGLVDQTYPQSEEGLVCLPPTSVHVDVTLDHNNSYIHVKESHCVMHIARITQFTESPTSASADTESLTHCTLL